MLIAYRRNSVPVHPGLHRIARCFRLAELVVRSGKICRPQEVLKPVAE